MFTSLNILITFRYIFLIYLLSIFSYRSIPVWIFSFKEIDSFWMVVDREIMRSALVEVESHYLIKERLHRWADIDHFPVVNVKRDYNTNSLNISVENLNTNIWILMSITSQSHFNLTGTFLSKVWLQPNILYRKLTIDFRNQNDWILANLQQSGKYELTNFYTSIIHLLYFYIYPLSAIFI